MNNIFDNIKTIAVVGISDKSDRPSNYVSKYMASRGFEIVPVNPNISSWNGLKCYPNISSIPASIHLDVINIFRKSEEVVEIVEDAVRRGDAHTIWMQEGVSSGEAAKLAQEHGMTVVMDTCIMKAHKEAMSIK